MDLNKHVWEGWTVQNFINELDTSLNIIQQGNSWHDKIQTKQELKKWCMDNQPYYKKHIPEVVNYFAKKYQIS